MSFTRQTRLWRCRIPVARPVSHARSPRRWMSDGPVIVGVTEEEIKKSREYCFDTLRKSDTPSYTVSTFVPPSAQDAFLALRTFNLEIARVADATSNPAVGGMRMQFWRDTIAKALEYKPPKEPVAILLSFVAANLEVKTDGRSKLSKVWLNRIINTREQQLDSRPFPDLAAVEMYAENTYSTLLYLTLSSMPTNSLAADHIASHIGKAQGITAVLRGLPILAFPGPPNKHSNQSTLGGQLETQKQGAVTLPLDIMAEAGVREEDVFRNGADAHGLRDAVFAVATRANDHLITAREMLRNLRAGQDLGHEFEHQNDEEHPARPGSQESELRAVEKGFGVYMPALATQLWLDQLQKYNFDIFDKRLRTTDWTLPWKAYWAFSRRKF